MSESILVVDLDAALLRSNFVLERFWLSYSSTWASFFSQGRKASIALEEAELAADPDVLIYVQRWRAKGGQTALVTAFAPEIARRIADQTGLFDEVIGADENGLPLAGELRARRLEERFGSKGFAYMGRSASDFLSWQASQKAITVNANPAVRAEVERYGRPVEHIVTKPPKPADYALALRPHQWLKNLLVFVPVLAAHDLSLQAFLLGLLTFLSFSLVASGVYVLNDLLDLQADRAHPRKRERPFASGRLPLNHGFWMGPGLLVFGSIIAVVVGYELLILLGAYFVATTAYSLALKRRAVIDIITLALLYTLRIIAGAAATGIPLSVWLLAFSLFLFVALAAVKRQAELVDNAAHGRLAAAGRGYTIDDTPIISMIGISAGYVAVLVLALYVNSPEILILYRYPPLLWGVCVIVLFWITHIVLVTHRGGMDDDPLVFAVRDRTSLVCLVLIATLVISSAK
jgi:4-hydroxybenzoate polyprenyltransferase